MKTSTLSQTIALILFSLSASGQAMRSVNINSLNPVTYPKCDNIGYSASTLIDGPPDTKGMVVWKIEIVPGTTRSRALFLQIKNASSTTGFFPLSRDLTAMYAACHEGRVSEAILSFRPGQFDQLITLAGCPAVKTSMLAIPPGHSLTLSWLGPGDSTNAVTLDLLESQAEKINDKLVCRSKGGEHLAAIRHSPEKSADQRAPIGKQ